MINQKELVPVDYIVSTLGLNRRYVVNTVVKAPDFPVPAVVFSRKTKLWCKQHVDEWVRIKTLRAERKAS